MGSVVVVDVVRVLGLGLSLRLRCRRAPLRALSGPWPCSGACSFYYLRVCVWVGVGVYVCSGVESNFLNISRAVAQIGSGLQVLCACVCLCTHSHTHTHTHTHTHIVCVCVCI